MVINDTLYMWGGRQSHLLYGVHNSDEKALSTSYVDTLYLRNGLWEKKATAGVPPLGVYGYSCTSINTKLCYFGGLCGHDPMEGVCNGYHNSINILDTGTLQWVELSPTQDSKVMRRGGSGMIAFNSNSNEDLVFTMGGCGLNIPPTPHQDGAVYEETDESKFNTNECNIFNITTREYTTLYHTMMYMYVSPG